MGLTQSEEIPTQNTSEPEPELEPEPIMSTTDSGGGSAASKAGNANTPSKQAEAVPEIPGVEGAKPDAPEAAETRQEAEAPRDPEADINRVREACKITRGAAQFQLKKYGGDVEATIRGFCGYLTPELKPHELEPQALAVRLLETATKWYDGRTADFKTKVKPSGSPTLTKRLIVEFLMRRNTFASQRRSNKCHVMYHWTSSRNREKVAEHGLLTRARQQKSAVKSASSHGLVFGDGVYAGNTPFDFSGYGDLLLVCIVCLGKHKRIYGGGSNADGANTIVGNKGSADSGRTDSDEVVLSDSDQVIPLFMLPKDMLGSASDFDRSEARLCGIGLESLVESFFDPTTINPSHEEYDRLKHASERVKNAFQR